MRDAVKLAHLSDLHLGPPHARKKARRARALIDHALARGADHLLLGGDLVDHGNLEDAAFLRRHLAKRGFLSADRLSVVPGNHDLWPFGEESLWGDAGRYLAGNLEALATFRAWPAQRRYEELIALFQESFPGERRRHRNDPYPCLKQVGPLTLALLDTTSNRGAFRSALGHFDPADGRWLMKELGRTSGPRLLLMHHWPLRWDVDAEGIVEDLPRPVRAAIRALRLDVTRFVDVNFERLEPVQRFIQRARFDAVLCGHVHMMSEDPRDPTFDASVGRVPVHCMGRSGAVHQDADSATYAYHLIEASPRAVKVGTVYVGGRALDG